MNPPSEVRTDYPCCSEGVCPQHVQQYRELSKWSEGDLLERRAAGNSKLAYRMFGQIAA